jgi:hypothetical protein
MQVHDIGSKIMAMVLPIGEVITLDASKRTMTIQLPSLRRVSREYEILCHEFFDCNKYIIHMTTSERKATLHSES